MKLFLDFPHVSMCFCNNSSPFIEKYIYLISSKSRVYALIFWSNLHVVIMSRTHFIVNLRSISCLNLKEIFPWNRRDIWSLSDSNWIPTHSHLVCKQTLIHLAKLAKSLSGGVSTYMYRTSYWKLHSCHVSISEWIYTL